MKITTQISRILSAILSPLIIPTYGIMIALWTTWLNTIQIGHRIVVVFVVFLFTCLIPFSAISLLMRYKIVNSIAMTNREERRYPYIIVAFSYIGCAIYLANINAPLWLIMFPGAAAIAAVTSAIINLWWKISIHTTAVAGLLALIVRIHSSMLGNCDMFLTISIGIIALGAIASARLALQRHTTFQLAAGAVNGFFWVYLLTGI